MRLLLSGEGPTDLGSTRPKAGGHTFVPGPMGVMVDVLLQARLGYSLLQVQETGGDCVRFVSESELAAAGKPGGVLLPGVKFGKGNQFFTRNAQVLGRMAKADSKAHRDPVIAVLFRDGDGTRSMPHGQWREKFDSINRGFTLVDCDAGVPMVPRPKSEAWLLCALKTPPYQHCVGLEDAPGNDGSARSLKGRLEALVGHATGADEQAQWVHIGRVDPARIEMPSFAAFAAELDRAATAAGVPEGDI